MTKEEKISLIVRNSDFTYEELEKLPMASIDSLYVAHVLEKNGGQILDFFLHVRYNVHVKKKEVFGLETITPTNLRKDMFKVLKEVANSNSEIEITMNSKNGLNDGIIMISKREWETLQEELYLQRTGTLDYVFNLMENEKDDDFEVV